MFERAFHALRRAEKKRSAAAAIDMRAPAALAIGVVSSGEPSGEEIRLAVAFGRAVQRSALELWPDLLRGDEAVQAVAFRPDAAGSYDFLIFFGEADDLEESFHGVRPPLFCARLASGAPPSLYRFEYDDEPSLVEHTNENPIEVLAASVFRPPLSGRGAARVRDFVAEGAPGRRRRFEYNLLLRLLGPREGRAAQQRPDPWLSVERLAPDGDMARELEHLRGVHDYADAHAVAYGDAWRSTVVSRSTLLLAPTIVSGAIGVAAPHFSNLTALAQLLIIARIFLDRRRAARERWQEKWIDYRELAERLRCLRYLTLCGVYGGVSDSAAEASWVSWYADRVERSMTKTLASEIDCQALLTHLVDAEIKDQIAYHRGVVRRFCGLDLRLRRISRGILVGSAAAGGAILVYGLIRYGFKGTPWPALMGLGLIVAPALVADLNGFRGEFDLVRQGERSARAAAGLSRLARNAVAGPVTPRALRRAAAAAARLMIGDTARWRSALELRAARLKRR
jgi:hypothetical protein